MNLNEVMREGMSEDCVSVWSHIEARGGSFSQLSCLRSEDVFSVTSFITTELMSLCYTCLFSPGQIAFKYRSSVLTLRLLSLL
jgi:hypothetical protein